MKTTDNNLETFFNKVDINNIIYKLTPKQYTEPKRLSSIVTISNKHFDLVIDNNETAQALLFEQIEREIYKTITDYVKSFNNVKINMVGAKDYIIDTTTEANKCNTRIIINFYVTLN